jgi:hypothetical protein
MQTYLAIHMPGFDEGILLIIGAVALIAVVAFLFLLFRFLWRAGSRKD